MGEPLLLLLFAALALVLVPVPKLLLMDFDVQFRDPRLEPLLNFSDSSVVDDRAHFFQEEAKESTRSDVADGLLHVFAEVPLDGGDCFLPRVLAQFNGHRGPPPGLAVTSQGPILPCNGDLTCSYFPA